MISLKKHPLAFLSLIYLLFLSALALFAPALTPYAYDEQVIEHRLEGPSTRHWMGTDSLGRDIYSRIVFGARLSLAVGVATALFALVLGVVTGSLAGYFGKKVDRVISLFIDSFYIFPYVLLAILMTLLFGRGLLGIFAALGLSTWVVQARLARGMVLQLKNMPFIEAARATGASSSRIILRHLIPNLTGPTIVALTFQIPANIMAESFLSFIGLGIEPPYSSWGTLAAEGFRAIRSFPHLIFFPGMALFITLLAFHFVGDAIKDSLDPRYRPPLDQ